MQKQEKKKKEEGDEEGDYSGRDGEWEGVRERKSKYIFERKREKKKIRKEKIVKGRHS